MSMLQSTDGPSVLYLKISTSVPTDSDHHGLEVGHSTIRILATNEQLIASRQCIEWTRGSKATAIHMSRAGLTNLSDTYRSTCLCPLKLKITFCHKAERVSSIDASSKYISSLLNGFPNPLVPT